MTILWGIWGVIFVACLINIFCNDRLIENNLRTILANRHQPQSEEERALFVLRNNAATRRNRILSILLAAMMGIIILAQAIRHFLI